MRPGTSASATWVVTWATLSLSWASSMQLPLLPRQLGQDLGVAGIGVARRVQGFLVDRRGDDRVDLAVHGEAHRALDRRKGEPAGLGAKPAGLDHLGGRSRLDQAHLRPDRRRFAAIELDREAEPAGARLDTACGADDHWRQLARI